MAIEDPSDKKNTNKKTSSRYSTESILPENENYFGPGGDALAKFGSFLFGHADKLPGMFGDELKFVLDNTVLKDYGTQQPPTYQPLGDSAQQRGGYGLPPGPRVDSPSLQPNDPRLGRITGPFGAEPRDPNQTGQFTPYTEEPSAIDQYYQLVEQSARDNAAAAQQSLKDYAEYGMAQLDADVLAFGEQVDEQQAAKIGLLQQSADQRKEDYTFMVESMGGEEAAAQTYLADMGIRDPAAFTQEPLNETQALLGTSYRSGAEAGLQIQSVLNFAADQIQNINMSNMTTSRANMLVNTALQAQSIQKWLNDSLLSIEMKKLEGKIEDEEQAKQNEAVAAYARALGGQLGLNADQVIAMDQFDILDDWANEMWKPDETSPMMVNPLTGIAAPNDEVLDQLKAFKLWLEGQEQYKLNEELGAFMDMTGK